MFLRGMSNVLADDKHHRIVGAGAIGLVAAASRPRASWAGPRPPPRRTGETGHFQRRVSTDFGEANPAISDALSTDAGEAKAATRTEVSTDLGPDCVWPARRVRARASPIES